GFIQNDPREGTHATYDTDVRVLYTDDALYFGVFAHDMEPSKIIISDLKKDYNTGSSDGFRIVLDTFHDGRNAYQFATNPAGAKWDSQMANEGRDNNSNWDGIWDVKTRITETGWAAEIWIPFRTLKFGDADPQVGGSNFGAGRTNQIQDMRLFFTRRIGLSDDGQALPILGGTRLSGRQGAYSIGMLNIQEREDGGVPSTNFTALRLRRDVLANSDI